MKYYIVDNVIGIVKTLENIIESRKIGEVIGYNVDPERAVQEIISLNPDIVLVDLLMSKKDGIALVEEVKRQKEKITFVMISQVADKTMIEQAYNAGVEFYINKPINVIEVQNVLGNIADKIRMRSIVTNIKGMFAEEIEDKPKNDENDILQEIKTFIGLLGLLGEKGTNDILSICEHIIINNVSYSKEVLEKIAAEKNDTAKNMEQRIRRTMKKGLTNVANLGIDDYANDVFQNYASYVYDFKSVKEEMDNIKGKNESGGRVNITKFIEGLMLYRQLEIK